MATVVGLYYNSTIETGGTNALTGQRAGDLARPSAWVTSHAYAAGDMVSDSGTAYGCNTAHTSGASLAADSLKWDSVGACSTVPITSIGTVYTLYFRAVESSTNNDPAMDSTTNVIFTSPTNVQVCQTYNGTFSSDPLQLTVPVTGGNQPVYIKQTSGVPSSPESLVIGALSWSTGSRVAQVGTVTLTPSAGQISASWDAVSGADGYEVYYKLSSSSTWIAATDVSSPSVITGLTQGSIYDVRVRAFDERGIGPYSATATDAVGTFYDSFAGSTGAPSASWTVKTAGSGTVALNGSGQLVCASPATVNATDGSGCYLTSAFTKGQSAKVKVKASAADTTTGHAPICFGLLTGASIPTPAAVATMNGSTLLRVMVNIDTDATPARWMDLVVFTEAGAATRWRESDDTWGASDYAITCAEDTYYNMTLETTSTQWRVTVKDETETTTLMQTTWRDFSATRPVSTSLWFAVGHFPLAVLDANHLVTVDDCVVW